MHPAVVVLVYVPVAIWVGTGVSLLVAFPRSAPGVVLRLAAAFLALWAILATTTLVWVLANGGASGVMTLLRSPLAIFEPQYALLWAAGALGAFGVLAIAFALNQLAGRGFLHLAGARPFSWPARLPAPVVRTSLLAYASDRPEAFSFALLEMTDRGRPRPHRHEVILLSQGLLDRLSPDEVEAVIAHEVGHLKDLDGRYLTFFRTLARMMRWDPVLASIAASLTRREEYRADDAAVALTGRPMALARALFKCSVDPPGPSAAGFAASFLGPGGRRGRGETVRRIERLVALAESGAYPPPSGD
ncbi:MAG TPA: M48 family metalloprotease [Thermoplasmata archaeon]|nr:M48 family metalloprotease [Thermoplasmata archaeon]